MVLSILAASTAYAGRPAEPSIFKASDFDVAEMIREADQTGDGKLNFEEFKKVSRAGLLVVGCWERARGTVAGVVGRPWPGGRGATRPATPRVRLARLCTPRPRVTNRPCPHASSAQAIVTARKVYEPALVDDHECACKVLACPRPAARPHCPPQPSPPLLLLPPSLTTAPPSPPPTSPRTILYQMLPFPTQFTSQVQSAFDFVDIAVDEEVDAADLTRLLEIGERMAEAANSVVQAKLSQGNYTNGGNRRKLQLPYEYQWSSVIQQWMKGVYTLKPDPYSYIPKAENKMSPPPPPGNSVYRNWPLLKPRWEGQTREERWWEVWGLANGGRRVDANGNRLRAGNREQVESLGRGKVRGCTPDVDDSGVSSSSSAAASDTPVCFNLKGDQWCADKASECTSELYVYTNCMALCSLDC